MIDLMLSIPNGWWIFGLVVMTFCAGVEQASTSTQELLNPLLKEGFWDGKPEEKYPLVIFVLLWFVCFVMTFITYPTY